ncbi:glycoside hydrolase family 88 protein [Sodalis ligni]|uniref:glycoside hydrolase family 88 protein n=1 Tax=Sodalis TaxID=84565 RepID=UPI00193F9F51|nr:glycoside hydrolase family 88 protein [Sodalis ligni]QWA10276.1 glycoside hydrolase family 88 protein [Sodalis ligni]
MDWLTAAITGCVEKVKKSSVTFIDFPHITENGKYIFTRDGVWTGGFWVGQLWLSYGHSGDPALRAAAEHFTQRILPRAQDSRNHDLGFMFYPSAITGWRITGNESWRQGALAAARSLAAQFNPAGGYIPGWGFFGQEEWSGAVLIDTLMNLPLLLWAAEQSGEDRLLQVANRHVEKTLANHLRADGSVYHRFHFTPDGQPVRGDTWQGLSADSAWSRGQGWALTGLAILAGQRSNPLWLASAVRVARYIIGHLPADGIPPWDYLDPDKEAPKDASAGAISAYGLLRLYRLTGEVMFKDSAVSVLHALSRHCMLDDNEGLLAHATADLPHGLGIDQATAYGDYYFLKALLELKDVTLCG